MKFLLDECITEPVARALVAIGLPVVYSPDVVGRGASDEVVYGHATQHKMSVITQDRGMGDSQTKQLIALGAGCGIFLFRRPKVDSSRLKLIRLLTIWELLESSHESTRPPFIYELRANGQRFTRVR